MSILFVIFTGIIAFCNSITANSQTYFGINLLNVPNLVPGRLTDDLQLATHMHLRDQLKTNSIAIDLIDESAVSNELTLFFAVEINGTGSSDLVKFAFDSESKISAYKELLIYYSLVMVNSTDSIQINVEGEQVWPPKIPHLNLSSVEPVISPVLRQNLHPSSTTIEKATDLVYIEMCLDSLPRVLSGRLLLEVEQMTRNFLFTESRIGNSILGLGDVRVVQQYFLATPIEANITETLYLDLLIDVSTLNFETNWISWIESAWYTNSDRELYTKRLRELDPVLFSSLKSVVVRVEGDPLIDSWTDGIISNETSDATSRGVISFIELHFSSMLDMITGNTRVLFKNVSESYLMDSMKDVSPSQIDVNIMYQKFDQLDETYVLHPHTLILGLSIITEFVNGMTETFVPQLRIEEAFHTSVVTTYMTHLRQMDAKTFHLLWSIDLNRQTDDISTPNESEVSPSTMKQVSEKFTITLRLRSMRSLLTESSQDIFEFVTSSHVTNLLSNRNDVTLRNITVTATIDQQTWSSESYQVASALSFPDDRRWMQEGSYPLEVGVSIYAKYYVSGAYTNDVGKLIGGSFQTTEHLSSLMEQLRLANSTVFEQLISIEIVDRFNTTTENGAASESGGKRLRWLIIPVVIFGLLS